jgi:hypothetical protein
MSWVKLWHVVDVEKSERQAAAFLVILTVCFYSAFGY